MSEKVVIARELAADIESLRSLGRSDRYFLDVRNFITEANRPSFPQNIPGGVIAAFLSENIMDNLPLYTKVIVNGYTVKQTPEEKVREYYDSLRVDLRRARGFCANTVEEVSREISGITKTLDLLGISIEGINA
jgi:hypothetical protein